ncbi:MAG: alpha/beta hydrolase family protein [Promethearchaeota archaeon]
MKRFVLIAFDLIFSAFIWYVNASWGNDFKTCLILSFTTFLIVYFPFEIYWNCKDLWHDRWPLLKIDSLEVSPIKIPVEGPRKAWLIGELIRSKNEQKRISRNSIIIVNQGFSDTKESLQYLYYPLALHGYQILIHDPRGLGKSKKVGKKTDHVQRIQDFDFILQWVMNQDFLKNSNIYCIGVSHGTLPALIKAFPNEKIKKIVVISSVANFRKTFQRLNPILKLRYYIRGNILKIRKEQNLELSPVLKLKIYKKQVKPQEWKKLVERLLLIHAKNDKITKFFNFEELISFLDVPPSNQILFKKGGHLQKKNELLIVASIIEFFNRTEN